MRPFTHLKSWTLVIALIICSIGHAESKLKSRVVDLGFSHANGTMGSFDVYLTPSARDKKAEFDLYIVPAKVDSEGDIASIFLANKNRNYKQLVKEVALFENKEIFVGHVTRSDLKNFDILGIVAANPKKNLIDSDGKHAFGQLPEIKASHAKSPQEEVDKTAKKTFVKGTSFGFSHCDGPFGSFDVYVIPASGKDKSVCELIIVPVTLDKKVLEADVVVANKKLNYKVLATQVKLKESNEISIGYISEGELANYDILSILPHSNDQLFPDRNADKTNMCTLPTIQDWSASRKSHNEQSNRNQQSH